MGSSDQTGLEAIFALSICLVLGCVMLVAFRYNDPQQNSVFSVFLIVLGVICSVGLVALFPTDFGAAIGEDRDTVEKSTFNPLFNELYRIFYWGCMVLNYIILPSMELVIRSGGIGFLDKLSDAASQIAKLLMAVIFVSGLFTFIFLAAENDWNGALLPSLEVTLIGISNTLGLVQITLFLGYGLVELPRTIWRSSDLENALVSQKLIVIREYRARDDARTKLQLALDDVYRFQQLVNDTVDRKKRSKLSDSLQVVISQQYGSWSDDDHRRAKNRAMAKPEDFMTVSSDMASIHKQGTKNKSQIKQEPISLSDLMLFRGKVEDWIRAHKCAEGRVWNCEKQTWYLEDVISAKNLHYDNLENQKSQNPYSPMHRNNENEHQLFDGIKWWDGTETTRNGKYWHIFIFPLAKKVSAIILVLLSLLILFVEFDALLVAATPDGSGGFKFSAVSERSPTICALFLAIVLGYVVAVLAWSSSQLSGSRECLIVPGRGTSALALSYYARTALGMAASLIFYSLTLLFPHLHVDGNGVGSETAFYKVYGDRVLTSKIANNFSVYFPAILLILVALQTCGVFARLLDKLGCGWLVFETLGKVDELELRRGDNRLTTRKGQAIRQAKQERLVRKNQGNTETNAGSLSLLFSSSSRGVSLQNVNETSDISKSLVDYMDDYGKEDVEEATGHLNDDGKLASGGSRGAIGRYGDQGIGRDLSDEWGAFPNKHGNNPRFNTSEAEKSQVSSNLSNSSSKTPPPAAAAAAGGKKEGVGSSSFNDGDRGYGSSVYNRSTVAADHSYLPPSSNILPQQDVVKKVITCKKCGEILPRDMDAIEQHDETCVGYNDNNNSAALSEANKVSADSQIIENAFVCPQCFKEFPSQRHVLDHFPSCDSGGGGGGAASNSMDGSERAGQQPTKSASFTSRMFGSSSNPTKASTSFSGDSNRPTLSLDSVGEGSSHSAFSDSDMNENGAVAALNDILTGGSGGGSCGPGMALSGWVEKHNKIKGWQRRWFVFNADAGRLQYYRYSGPSEFSGEPQPELLELKGVIDIRYVDIGHKPGEFRRINIEAGKARQYKLKVKSDAEGRHWCEQLQVWKDHFTE